MRVRLHPVLVLASGMAALGLAMNASGQSPDEDSSLPAEATPAPAAAPVDPKMLQGLAQDMLQQVGAARLALAVKDVTAASKHLAIAENDLEALSESDTHSVPTESNVQAGRLSSSGGKETYLYPLPSMTMTSKQVIAGPFWSPEKGIAVEDAELIRVSLTIDPDRAISHIREANAKMAEGDLPAASSELSRLSAESIKTEGITPLRLQSATDNLALADYFLSAANYDAARFALRHAKEAIAALQKDKNYAAQQADITAMQQEVDALRESLTKKDPTLLDKAKAQVKNLWSKTTGWAKPT